MPNYFVCKKDGTKELVPEIIANAILEAKAPKIKWKSKLGYHMIDLSLISELLTEEEYYQKHPDNRPTQKYPELPVKKYNKQKQISALESMIRGMRMYLEKNPGGEKAAALLENMQKTLIKTQNASEIIKELKDIMPF